jgi:hypothetical protein
MRTLTAASAPTPVLATFRTLLERCLLPGQRRVRHRLASFAHGWTLTLGCHPITRVLATLGATLALVAETLPSPCPTCPMSSPSTRPSWTGIAAP